MSIPLSWLPATGGPSGGFQHQGRDCARHPDTALSGYHSIEPNPSSGDSTWGGWSRDQHAQWHWRSGTACVMSFGSKVLSYSDDGANFTGERWSTRPYTKITKYAAAVRPPFQMSSQGINARAVSELRMSPTPFLYDGRPCQHAS